MRYNALVDGKAGAYAVAAPDLPAAVPLYPAVPRPAPRQASASPRAAAAGTNSLLRSCSESPY